MRNEERVGSSKEDQETILLRNQKEEDHQDQDQSEETGAVQKQKQTISSWILAMAGVKKSPRSADFAAVNEKPVDDVSLNFFYEPRTLTLLCVAIGTLVYIAFNRDESDLQDNITSGFTCVVFFFLVISILAFPNGPFTRPHPAIWRMVFGLSVLYLMFLNFILFQNYQTVKSIFLWFDPALSNFSIDSEKEYGVNCSQITVERVWSHVDVFALAHFLGWILKAVLVRHVGILWTISVTWEITEVAFAHLLPNFIECWWDAIVLDIFLCNGIGIWVGMKLCKLLEMREYKWESIKTIQGTTKKLKRAVLQFTPESWTPVRWLDPTVSYMRLVAVCQLVVFWQIAELNTFFIKHIFETPPAHKIVLYRLGLLSLIVAPSLRQYYVYVTDARCKRVGTQCWVLGAITATEAVICAKFGRNLLGQAQIKNIILWNEEASFNCMERSRGSSTDEPRF
ncbi:unnamed protein product [Allacma fusca]|uniref:Phosphatidylserine synthase n=1 Tax=Allacma fusca TaxID=39272 RepID=A0A8J2LNW3_9HEXA|nr:unnamed protein product [Allacma fusca]